MSFKRFDTPTLASAGVALFAVLVFVVNLPGQHGPLLLLWLAAPLSVVAPVVAVARISRTPGFAAPTRRFWRHLVLTLAFVGLGALLNTYDGTAHGPSPDMSAGTSAAYGGAVLTLLWALWRLPLGVQGPGDRLRIGLDAGTVLLAAAVFMWHYQTRPLLEVADYRPGPVLAVGATLVLELVAVFAIAKVALSGDAFVARGSLHLFAGGMIAGAVSGVLQRFIVDKPHLSLPQVIIPLVMVCVPAAAHRQRQALDAPERRRAAGGRPFSILPYLAVAAVDVLLLFVIAVGDADAQVAAIAAVMLTGLVVWRQITAFQENSRLVARLDHHATHDALTGLPNRVLFNERLAAALAGLVPRDAVGTGTKTDRPVSVALIDLNDFKLVNDTLGHGAGDALLVAVARRLVAAVRPADLVARLGGDEFVVVLDGAGPAEADRAAQRMITALAEPVVADGHELLVRASIGLADGRPGDDAGELLRRADIAMYAAKHEGGGGCQRYAPGMAGAVAGSAGLGAELRQAITNGELFLQYQPIVALGDGRLTGVEALARWTSPARGAVPPAQFIPIAERTGLIVPLGAWVLREACRQMAAWSAGHGPLAPAVIHVNVAARQLAEESFVDLVRSALADAGLEPHRLTLEITERTAVALGDAVAHLEQLRLLGVRVALDDFGTDQSSLALLRDLPVDELKLDRSFVDADTTGRRGAMPGAVLALARAVGLEIVAEGVEDGAQADRLAALGYRSAQGYHFARPMAAEGIDRLMTAVPA
ncbi:putative bifunctional diguanylate cyclase/phosphodiesterase [Dactylosporangium sp. CA-139066]|uniref:putative bifunctional diguanylate cyclase/phosphodiesterase n=1 Tax=Dactylosporangium sp. CA-139066 TaxID=3239930 RepID=UPI003D938FFD